ncbi:hypothetical protein ACYZX9_11330 [Sphingomonas citri]
MAGDTIEHDASRPWGWWMRTVGTPFGGVVIVDEHGRQWQSLREALWGGRLELSLDRHQHMEEGLELLLAVLASSSRGIVGPVEQLHALFAGMGRFARFYSYWLHSTGLVANRSALAMDLQVTAEGASVLRMLAATRPPKLAAVPIGPLALAAFGAPGSSSECTRARFNAMEGMSRRLVYAFVREEPWRRPTISLLHRNHDDTVPLARTIWSAPFHDEASRDRVFGWMYERLDRWTVWGELVRAKGAHALTQELLSLVMLGGDTTAAPGPPPPRDGGGLPVVVRS